MEEQRALQSFLSENALSKFDAFLRSPTNYEQLVDILLQPEEGEKHYALKIQGTDLCDEAVDAFHGVCLYPRHYVPVLEERISMLQRQIMDDHELKSEMTFKSSVHLRIYHLMNGSEFVHVRVPRATEAGRLVEFQGTVIRVSTVKMLEYEREYMCSKCKHVFTQQAEFEQYYAIPKPTFCPNSLEAVPCDSTKFTPLNDGEGMPKACRDYQEIKIQEQVQKLAVGTIPRSIWAVLEMDLVDACKAGDDVSITGIVMRRWSAVRLDARCDIETVLLANHIKVNNNEEASFRVTEEMKAAFEKHWHDHVDRPLSARNKIIASFCPQVFGMYVVKLAVMLLVVGGVPRVDPSGSRTRGESHMLLVGDPGTGKSQFLKYATKLVPRSVITTGVGSTSAGLTVTAVKDGGEWTLEAGALVLADGGLCCIDEFNGIRGHDRSSIHEAMEQQTLSVAKAGLVCKLNTRTSVLAATNPKGTYDPDQSLSVNVALASPLLSRFDIILVLMDTKNPDWDRVVSSFILHQRSTDNDDDDGGGDKNSKRWNMAQLKAYVAYVKTLHPVLGPKAEVVLSRYYQLQRSAESRSAARTTIRLLESMVRLAQAHARLMCRETVELMDAIAGLTIIESSMQGGALLGHFSPLHSAFPKNPEAEYIRQERLILERLGLTHLGEDYAFRKTPNSPSKSTQREAGATGAAGGQQQQEEDNQGQQSSPSRNGTQRSPPRHHHDNDDGGLATTQPPLWNNSGRSPMTSSAETSPNKRAGSAYKRRSQPLRAHASKRALVATSGQMFSDDDDDDDEGDDDEGGDEGGGADGGGGGMRPPTPIASSLRDPLEAREHGSGAHVQGGGNDDDGSSSTPFSQKSAHSQERAAQRKGRASTRQPPSSQQQQQQQQQQRQNEPPVALQSTTTTTAAAGVKKRKSLVGDLSQPTLDAADVGGGEADSMPLLTPGQSSSMGVGDARAGEEAGHSETVGGGGGGGGSNREATAGQKGEREKQEAQQAGGQTLERALDGLSSFAYATAGSRSGRRRMERGREEASEGPEEGQGGASEGQEQNLEPAKAEAATEAIALHAEGNKEKNGGETVCKGLEGKEEQGGGKPGAVSDSQQQKHGACEKDFANTTNTSKEGAARADDDEGEDEDDDDDGLLELLFDD